MESCDVCLYSPICHDPKLQLNSCFKLLYIALFRLFDLLWARSQGYVPQPKMLNDVYELKDIRYVVLWRTNLILGLHNFAKNSELQLRWNLEFTFHYIWQVLTYELLSDKNDVQFRTCHFSRSKLKDCIVYALYDRMETGYFCLQMTLYNKKFWLWLIVQPYLLRTLHQTLKKSIRHNIGPFNLIDNTNEWRRGTKRQQSAQIHTDIQCPPLKLGPLTLCWSFGDFLTPRPN